MRSNPEPRPNPQPNNFPSQPSTLTKAEQPLLGPSGEELIAVTGATLKDRISLPGNLHSLTQNVFGNIAFALSEQDGQSYVVAIDIGNPHDPKILKVLEHPNTESISLLGNTLTLHESTGRRVLLSFLRHQDRSLTFVPNSSFAEGLNIKFVSTNLLEDLTVAAGEFKGSSVISASYLPLTLDGAEKTRYSGTLQVPGFCGGLAISGSHEIFFTLQDPRLPDHRFVLRWDAGQLLDSSKETRAEPVIVKRYTNHLGAIAATPSGDICLIEDHYDHLAVTKHVRQSDGQLNQEAEILRSYPKGTIIRSMTSEIDRLIVIGTIPNDYDNSSSLFIEAMNPTKGTASHSLLTCSADVEPELLTACANHAQALVGIAAPDKVDSTIAIFRLYDRRND